MSKCIRMLLCARLQRHLLMGISIIWSNTWAELIQNGGFEQGPDPNGGFVTVNAGSNQIPFWSVTKRSIDILGAPRWVASDGSRSVDLDGTPGAGAIAQTFNTIPGQRYVVEFYLAGNPEGQPIIKTMQVSAAGQTRTFTFSTSGKSGGSMGWTKKRWEFIAEEYQTTLEFSSLNAPPEDRFFGASIDNVRVYEISCSTSHDFNGDGKTDILWRNNATGQVWLYLMDGDEILSSTSVTHVADLNWQIKQVGDFDGDGKADVLWRHSVTGEIWMYLMEGAHIQSSTSVGTVSDLNWQIVP